jgi:hypothetical protein
MIRFPEGATDIYLFSKASRTALATTQSPTQIVLQDLHAKVKRRWCEADHAPHLVPRLRMSGAILPRLHIPSRYAEGLYFSSRDLSRETRIQIHSVITSEFARQQEIFKDEERDKRAEDCFDNSCYSCRNRSVLAFWRRASKHFVVCLQYKTPNRKEMKLWTEILNSE